MSTRPSWYADWEPVRRALVALAVAARTNDKHTREDNLRRFATNLAPQAPNLDAASIHNMAAEVGEALHRMFDLVDLPLQDGEDAEAAIAIWYWSACEGLSRPEIADALGQRKSWVTQRAGGSSTTEAAWPGLQRVMSAVLLARARSTDAADTSAVAAARYAFSRLDGQARALALACSMLDPGSGLRVAVEALAARYYETFPPLRNALQEAGLLRRLQTLVTAELLQRRSDDFVIGLATVEALHRSADEETLRDLAGQLVQAFNAALPDEPMDARVWPTYALLASHAVTTCKHAFALNTDVDDASEVIDRISRYERTRHRPEQAIALSTLAIDAHRAAHTDPEVPGVIHLLNNRAMAYHDAADEPAALRDLDKSVSIGERLLGDGPQLAGTLVMRGDVLRALGQRKRATSDYRRSLAVTMLQGADDPIGNVTESLNDLAVTLEPTRPADAASLGCPLDE